MTDRELLESLLEKITSIEANMATKDDIARLEAKIDVLAHRTFEQEADIQLLKKAK